MFFHQGNLIFANNAECFGFYAKILAYAKESVRQGSLGFLADYFRPDTPVKEKSSCYKVDSIELNFSAFLNEKTNELVMDTAQEKNPANLYCTIVNSENLGLITTKDTQILLRIHIKEHSSIESIEFVMLLQNIVDTIARYDPDVE